MGFKTSSSCVSVLGLMCLSVFNLSKLFFSVFKGDEMNCSGLCSRYAGSF